MASAGPANAAARKPRTPALVEAIYNLATGDAWGTIARGKACDSDPRPVVRDAALSGSTAGFPAIFAATLNVDASRPTLRVEAAIGGLSARLCALSGKRATGALAMTVTWKIFAPTRDTALAIVETHASGDAGELASDNLTPLIEARLSRQRPGACGRPGVPAGAETAAASPAKAQAA